MQEFCAFSAFETYKLGGGGDVRRLGDPGVGLALALMERTCPLRLLRSSFGLAKVCPLLKT